MADLIPIEHNGQRVLVSMQLAESFGTDIERIQINFNRNKDRYKDGKHYFLIQGGELKTFKATYQIDNQLKYASSFYLWTEKGAWLHAKSLNTDQSWEAYEMLVDDYYRVKESQFIDTSKLSPEMQMFKQIWDSLAFSQIEQAETKLLAMAANEKAVQAESTITALKETFLHRDENWRKWVNDMLNGAVKRLGGGSEMYRELKSRSYKILSDRAGCKLDTRLRNLKLRLEESGATKSRIKDANKLDVIEEEKKLKEIYSSVVKELAMGTM
jgi:hypothetical protein